MSKRKREVEEDPRFSHLSTSAKFRPISKKLKKVEVDDRFKDVNSEKFSTLIDIDRYGRKVSNAGPKKPKRKPQQEEESSETDLSSSETSLSSSSDAEMDSESEGEEIPTGEATKRVAVVGIDWNLFRASDLWIIFNSFLPPMGVLLSITVYISDYGKQQIAHEQEHGPPVFSKLPGEETEVDLKEIRKHEKSKRKYYFAVVDCDSIETANSIYMALNGTQIEGSSRLDLRFIEDELSFEGREIKSNCKEHPSKYQPLSDFLQHDKLHTTQPELEWDEEDKERSLLTRRAFTKDELNEMDFAAYLDSGSSSSSEDEATRVARYKQLLLGGGSGSENEEKSSMDEEEEIGSMVEGEEEMGSMDEGGFQDFGSSDEGEYGGDSFGSGSGSEDGSGGDSFGSEHEGGSSSEESEEEISHSKKGKKPITNQIKGQKPIREPRAKKPLTNQLKGNEQQKKVETRPVPTQTKLNTKAVLNKKKNQTKDEGEDQTMEMTFKTGLVSKTAKLIQQQQEGAHEKTVFEKYLEKKAEQKRARKELANQQKTGIQGSEDGDPWATFDKELKQDSRLKNKHKKKNRQLSIQDKKSQAELELLTMDPTKNKKEEAPLPTKKKAKKKLQKEKEKIESEKAAETILSDSRFLPSLVKDPRFAIDPTRQTSKKDVKNESLAAAIRTKKEKIGEVNKQDGRDKELTGMVANIKANFNRK